MVFPRAGVGNPVVYHCGNKEQIKRGIPDFYGAGTLRTLILPFKKKVGCFPSPFPSSLCWDNSNSLPTGLPTLSC